MERRVFFLSNCGISRIPRPKPSGRVFLIGETNMNQAILDIRDQVGEPLAATVQGQDCCSTSSTTSIRTFLDRLRGAKPDQQVVFQLDQAVLVETGYHVTEVRAVTYSTMDCGGVADQWKETVIQLWNPGDEPEREYMTVKKFLAIYDRVAEHIPVSDNAEVRFEYGDMYRAAASYHVERIESREALILVHLRAPAVTCKARDCRARRPDAAASHLDDILRVHPWLAAERRYAESRGRCLKQKNLKVSEQMADPSVDLRAGWLVQDLTPTFYENECRYRSVFVRQAVCDADAALSEAKPISPGRASSGRGRSLFTSRPGNG
jgi:hypothetical protein